MRTDWITGPPSIGLKLEHRRRWVGAPLGLKANGVVGDLSWGLTLVRFHFQ